MPQDIDKARLEKIDETLKLDEGDGFKMKRIQRVVDGWYDKKTLFCVYGIPKDDDITNGHGRLMEEFETEGLAEEYVARNTSPDNFETYEVRPNTGRGSS